MRRDLQKIIERMKAGTSNEADVGAIASSRVSSSSVSAAIASNVVKFDRSSASLANRDRPDQAMSGGLLLSID